MLVFTCLNGLTPSYLCDLIELYKPSRNLRLSNEHILKVFKTKYVTLGDKSFYYAAPIVWNELPIELRKETSIDIFKGKLQTFYFKTSPTSVETP